MSHQAEGLFWNIPRTIPADKKKQTLAYLEIYALKKERKTEHSEPKTSKYSLAQHKIISINSCLIDYNFKLS